MWKSILTALIAGLAASAIAKFALPRLPDIIRRLDQLRKVPMARYYGAAFAP
jgi:multisubunit Na+/H+ antiporter MnhG subunit